MRKLYTLNLGQDNGEIEKFVLEKLNSGEDVSYILPTVDAIEKVKKYYIEKLGGFINLTFYTFDSLKKKLAKTSNVDEPLSLYIISLILKKNNYKLLRPVSDGLIEKTANFIKRAKEELVDFNGIKSSKSQFLQELGDVAIKYDLFLKKNGLCDGLENNFNTDNIDFKNIVVDGFYTYKKVDLLILEEIAKCESIIVNMPYFFGNLQILEDTKKDLFELGFVEENKTSIISTESKIEEYRNKINFIFEENENLEARVIFQELKKKNIRENIPFEKMAIIYALENKSIINLIEDENFELNLKSLKVGNAPLVQEFLNILDYSLDQSRENIFRIIDNYYFKITKNPEEMDFEFRKVNFNNLNTLIENIRENLEVSEDNLSEFILLVESLNNLPNKVGRFKEFSSYFLKYIPLAEEYIKKSYEIFQNDDLLVRDMNIISSIKSILEKLEQFDLFFGQESLENYINLLKIYISNIQINKRNDFASKYSSLIESIYLDYNCTFICGLRDKYPNYKEGNFIFSDDNKKILKENNMKTEDDLYIYENELVKIMSLMERSKEIYLSNSSLESSSVFLDLFLGENNNVNLVKKDEATNFSDLFLEIVKNEKNNNRNIDKIKHLNYIGEIKYLNERIYGEQNRGINKYNGYISGIALKEVQDIIEKIYFSPTSIDLYAECPFRFLFEKLLKVEELNRDYDDKFYLNIGNYYHEVLEEYFKNNPDTFDENYLYKLCFLKMFTRKAFGEKLSNIESLAFNYHYGKIKAFIENDLNNRNGESPYKFEDSFFYNIEKMKITGRIDRIDKIGEDEIIIDYKRKYTPSKKSVIDGKKYQLPIYILSRKENVIDAKYGKIEEASYVSIIRNKDKLGGRSAMSTYEIDEFLEETKKRLSSIYESIISGKFPYIKCENNGIEDLCRGEVNE